MNSVLMDRLHMMVKLKERIHALKNSSEVDKSEIKKLEKLLKTLQTTPNSTFI